jgi:NADH:ubiquinone oxidoreductase subunit
LSGLSVSLGRFLSLFSLFIFFFFLSFFFLMRALVGTISKLMDTNILRVGKHMGTDELGNNYYEMLPGDTVVERKRWVEPNRYYFDSSEICPKYHSWLTYCTDEFPTGELQVEEGSRYVTPHRMNLTGTERAYRPPGYAFQKHHYVQGKKLDEGITAEELNAELRASKKD